MDDVSKGSATYATGTESCSSQVDSTQFNAFRSYISVLADSTAKDELKLKAAQELSEHFEVITQCAGYTSFLEHSMKIFLTVLQEGDPHFISEDSIHQVRKLILEMIHRLPTSESLRPYVKPILSLCLALLRTDNEENVLVCLRIIIELHKQYRPAFNQEIQFFLTFVKTIYSDLPKHLPKIFEPRQSIRVSEVKDLNLDQLLAETYTITTIQVDKKSADGTVATVGLLYYLHLQFNFITESPP